MALSETVSETSLCNRSLGRIGANQIRNVETDTSVQAIQCRLHYEPTRNALQRSHKWRFARARIKLVSAWETDTAYTTDQYVSSDSVFYKSAVAHTSSSATEPPGANWTTISESEDFEWDNEFDLPVDFLRFRSIFEERGFTSRSRRHAIEGQILLTNFSEIGLRYVKKVTDVSEFDFLYTEILVLQVALKLLGPLAGGDRKLRDTLQSELKPLLAKAQAVDSDETDVGGRSDWNLARHGGLGITGVPERLL